MIVDPTEQSLRQRADERFNQASASRHRHTRAAWLKAVLAAVTLVLLAIATFFGLHLVF